MLEVKFEKFLEHDIHFHRHFIHFKMAISNIILKFTFCAILFVFLHQLSQWIYYLIQIKLDTVFYDYLANRIQMFSNSNSKTKTKNRDGLELIHLKMLLTFL